MEIYSFVIKENGLTKSSTTRKKNIDNTAWMARNVVAKVFVILLCSLAIFLCLACPQQEVEFSVTNVQIHGGYVLHVGAIEGTLRVGDQMKCLIDEV